MSAKITNVELINGKLCYETDEGGGGYIQAEKILELAALDKVKK